MKNRLLAILVLSAVALPVLLWGNVDVLQTAAGLTFGRAAGDLIAFHGSTPVAQRTSAAQTALTDNTGGSVSAATLSTATGMTTLTIPVQLASMTTSAADLVTTYTLGYKFKIVSADFATTTIGAGSGASQTLSLAITGVAVTGGAVNPTLAGTNTLGKLTAGTAVTAANTGLLTDTLSVKVAASGTVFTAGSGVLIVRIQNMDTADAVAREAVLINELRAALVEKGLIKGS